jgi:hypothetical protein
MHNTCTAKVQRVLAWHKWFMPVILAIQEAEIKRIAVQKKPWRTGVQTRSCLRDGCEGWDQCEREDVGKVHERMSTVQMLCTHVCKWKKRTVETIPGMGERIKENSGGGESKYDIFDTS